MFIARNESGKNRWRLFWQNRLPVRPVSTFIFLFLFIFICVPGKAQARSYSFPEVNITAEVLEDGSMLVNEERTVQFNGTYSGLFQWIYKDPGVDIVDVVVSEDGVQYEFNPGSTYGPAGTYYIVDEPGQFYVDWSFNATDEQRTFTLNYRVLNAVKVHADVAELYYKFIGDESEMGTQKVYIWLILPPGAERQDLRAWGHGPPDGEVYIADERSIVWQVNKLPARTFVEGRVTFPPALVPGSTNLTDRAALPGILAEEEAWADQANRERFMSRASWLIAVMLILLSGIAAFFFWYKYGRKHRTTFDGAYYRELPSAHTPAEVGVLWRFGKVIPADFTATIIDLARRGFFRLEEYVPEPRGFFRRRKKIDYRIVNLGKKESIAKHEYDLFVFLFQTIADNSATVTFSEIEQYARRYKDSFAAFWSRWSNALHRKGEQNKFFDHETKKGKRLVTITGIGLAVLGLAVTFLSESLTGSTYFYPPALTAIGCGLFILLTGRILRRRSPQGEEDFVRWRAFRNFLLHFSRMHEHEIPSLIIWEHYLVYAVTLGVAREVLKQLQLVYPNLQEGDYRFGYGWYYFDPSRPAFSGVANSLQSLTSSIQTSMQQSLRAATSKSSSGSGGGGGFSGGGGGGGGGGGVGAR